MFHKNTSTDYRSIIRLCLAMHRWAFIGANIFHTYTTFIQRYAKTTQGHQGTSRGEWQKMAGWKGKAVDKDKAVGKSIERIEEANPSTGQEAERDLQRGTRFQRSSLPKLILKKCHKTNAE